MEGRKPGFTVDEECRRKTMLNNPKRREIKTDDGIFPSIKAASRFYNIPGSLVMYYCAIGEKQRLNGLESTKIKRDYRNWEILTKTPKHAFKIKVKTPLGEYNSMTEAARAHNVSISAISQRISKRTPGWNILKD